MCRRAGADRMHVFDVENHDGTPVYVHAKVCVVDDVWASVGSDNFNRRSWTHDSELSCAVLDDTRDDREPRDPAGQRRRRAGASPGTCGCSCCASTWTAPRRQRGRRPARPGHRGARRSQRRRRRWSTGTRRAAIGPTPTRPAPAPPTRAARLDDELWAVPAYRLIYDPDGRSYRQRISGTKLTE